MFETKYSKPFRVTENGDGNEFIMWSGDDEISYGLKREGDMYEYIDWWVPMLCIRELSPYFDKNEVMVSYALMDWIKDSIEKKGYNMSDVNIIKYLK